jgi:hypothetical protein
MVLKNFGAKECTGGKEARNKKRLLTETKRILFLAAYSFLALVRTLSP